MDRTCAVCREPITGPKVRLEGITEASDDESRPWVWGPFTVHDDCRTKTRTPYEELIGDGFMSTWEIVDRDADIPEPTLTAPPER